MKTCFNYNLPPLTNEELAYIAGIVDGEGSIGRYKSHNGKTKPIYHFKIKVGNTNREMLDWLHSKLQAGHIYSQKTYKPHHKPAWQFMVEVRNETVTIVKALLPYLIIKKPAAELLLSQTVDL